MVDFTIAIKLLLQEYLVPEEYIQVMRASMLNKCPVSSYDQVCEVIKKELGETPDKVSFILSMIWDMSASRISPFSTSQKLY